MRCTFLIALAALSLGGEILDRIALVVGQTVITESQLDEDLRVTAFLNQKPVVRDRDARKAAANRLIEQVLVRREILVTHYPPPSAAETARLYAETEKEYGGAIAIEEALARSQLTEAILKEHLELQLTILKFIDVRFRPDVEISEKDIGDYYKQELETWPKGHQGAPPTLEQSRASIVKTLSDERSEYALSSWIDEARRDANIVYVDKDLDQP
jgi:hypothetical protein